MHVHFRFEDEQRLDHFCQKTGQRAVHLTEDDSNKEWDMGALQGFIMVFLKRNVRANTISIILGSITDKFPNIKFEVFKCDLRGHNRYIHLNFQCSCENAETELSTAISEISDMNGIRLAEGYFDWYGRPTHDNHYFCPNAANQSRLATVVSFAATRKTAGMSK